MNSAALGGAAFCALAAIVGYILGDTYIERLPHHAGYFLVPVDDEVGVEHPHPRHSILIVVDGLGREPAEKMEVVRRLREAGQCRTTDVGALTVSRPVYAVVSTGLEQDRTGSRNNDETSPLAADSIWQSARRAGLEVTAISPEPFWRQLFPEGFSSYDVAPKSDDLFARAQLADLTLIHPLYVDDAGHAHGAASKEYGGAVARADREALGLLDRIDLDQDLVVMTADHGHMSYGGHGGPQRELRLVTTCFAGRGVRTSSIATGALDARSIAPAMSVLIGIPFPKHMRALEDDLDVIFEVADVSTMSTAYVTDRKAAVERFRDTNREKIGSWSSLYSQERIKQHTRLAIVITVMIGAAAIVLRRRRLSIAGALGSVAWCGLVVTSSCVAFGWLRGSLTFTAINARAEFMRAGFAVCGTIAVLSLVLHWLVWRDRGRSASDHLLLVGLTLGACLAHALVYGWPIGFPLPSAEMLFFPFLAPIFLLVHAVLAPFNLLFAARYPRHPSRE